MINRLYLSFTMLFLLTMFSSFAGDDVFDDIAVAIKSGNAREVSRYFGARVEMRIIDKENVYSKTQAEIVLKEFFSNNGPSDFRIIHKGSSEKGARYAIGNLETSNGSYRAYLFIKLIGDQFYIQELRFEKD